MPRTACRVLGALLRSGSPAQSLTDLCARVNACKSAISTTTRLLIEMKLIERVPSPVTRQVFFQFRPGGWAVSVRQHLRLWASLHRIAERRLDLQWDKDPSQQRRLQEAHDIFTLIDDELSALLGRVDRRRKE